MTTNEARIVAHFTAQAWVRDYAIEVDPPGDTEWDATEAFGALPDEYREELRANMTEDGAALDGWDLLKDDPAAPEWCRTWSGPFDIHVREG